MTFSAQRDTLAFMVCLYLVNQPESTWMKEEKCEGQSDTSLTALGKACSQKIGYYFKDKPISGLFTSSLHRTNQCARIIAGTIPLKVKRDERLADMNLGLWQGKFPEEIESRYPDIWEEWKKDPAKGKIPSGESWAKVEERTMDFLGSFHDDELFDKHFIVVTHDIIIRIVLSKFEKKQTNEIWTYQLDKASITEVQLEPENKIIVYNYTDHLYVSHFT